MRGRVLLSQLWNVPSRVGSTLGWEWLIYNPGVFLEYDMVARRNAPNFARSLLEVFPRVNSLCDLGAGTGGYVKAFRDYDIGVDGFEYTRTARYYAKLRGIQLEPFDLAREPAIPYFRKYDLAYSLEVGEHIPHSLSMTFVSLLTKLSPIIILTCAQPGQKGHGHINCQKKRYWRDLFAEKSFVYNEDLYVQLISRLKQHPRLSSFLINNLMIFTES